MPFHIFIQTIFKPQLPKCPNVFMSLLSAQPEIWSSWFVVTIEMSQTISHFHFTASHVVSDSLWFNCVKQFLNCSTAVLSLQRDTSERDINFKSVCLITLSHYCEKYSSLQLRRLSVCVEQLLTNDNNPSCCIIGGKVTKPLQTEVLLEQQSSQSQNPSSWEIPTSNTSLSYLCL